MRRFLIAGNWKMNGTADSSRQLAAALAAAVPQQRSAADVLVCPPSVYLSTVAAELSGSSVALGAQDVYFESSGAFTGETAVEMLLDVGCKYVIVGHSERRHILGETDELINKKALAALRQELTVILCVGELLSEREADQTRSVLDRQMEGGLAQIEVAQFRHLVIAYEPVWAIGTGVTATPDQAESAHQHLRNWLESRYNSEVAGTTQILYGGSVKADNAEQLLGQPNVDGALVGGASLQAETFLPIVDAAEQMQE